ncbi:Tctex1 domain-containing protein 2-like [Oopsacas minuta]|uniref:Tctex1 domain-containing protein 2-like n=1 Tax=Oopsacas minuta TaxID=111878 RepID=A0AAV7JVZ3_9METZ|nr:Tctex1 domain-containing protein 2-like [Oopsacas minuta]
MSEIPNEQPRYSIRPHFSQKFRPIELQELLNTTLREELDDKEYSSETVPSLTKEISDQIREKFKQLDLPRYKILVQVIIGEARGGGVKIAARCFWDNDTDSYLTAHYMSKSIFAVATVFGVYYY